MAMIMNTRRVRGFDEWIGPIGAAKRCGERITVLEIYRDDWRRAYLRCSEHATGRP